MDMMLKTTSSKYTANVRNVTDLCLGLKKNLRLNAGIFFCAYQKVMVTVYKV